MRLFTPLVPDPAAVLARANPVAKLAAALLLMAVLFISADPVTPALVLVLLVASVALSGLSAGTLLARAWPLLAAAIAVGLLNAGLAPAVGGDAGMRIGPLVVTVENLVTGVGLALRLLAIALTGLLALASTDPTDLADALVQQLRVSPRLAVGALAALRLLPILADEWQTIGLARRARGMDAGRSPIAALRLFFGKLLALLVSAVRRATRLAIAMEARGFGSGDCRTVARPQRMRAADWALIAASAAGGAAAVGLSLAFGSWRFLLGQP